MGFVPSCPNYIKRIQLAEKKMIAVVGATGAQGGGLVRAILRDVSGGFTTRALTRNVDSDKRQSWPSSVPRLLPPTLTT